MAQLSRRAVLGATGAVCLTAVVPTPSFATDDGELLRLFNQWSDLIERSNAPERLQIDNDPLLDEADAVAEEIAEVPAAGAIGVAIKMHIALREEIFVGRREADFAGLGPHMDGDDQSEWLMAERLYWRAYNDLLRQAGVIGELQIHTRRAAASGMATAT